MISLQLWKKALLCASENVVQNEEYLCDLDRGVGDGDHGLTVARGFRSAKKYLESSNDTDFYSLNNAVGRILSNDMGGAIGPIFQTIFYGMAIGSKDSTEIDLPTLEKMFSSSLQRVKIVGGAKEGDKTLVDSLSPACTAITNARIEGLSIKQALQNASRAAHEGCLSTKNMIAKKGRAKYLAEKSLTYQDAGATTMYLVIQAISKCIDEMTEE